MALYGKLCNVAIKSLCDLFVSITGRLMSFLLEARKVNREKFIGFQLFNMAKQKTANEVMFVKRLMGGNQISTPRSVHAEKIL